MSYANMADAQLRKAFNLLKDLALWADLTKRESSGFNFGTGAAQVTAEPPTRIKIVVLTTEKPSKETKLVTKTIMLKRADVGELGFYSTIGFGGHTWKFGDSIKDSGFILITKVFRES